MAGVGRLFVAIRPPESTRHDLAARLDRAFADRPLPGRRVEPDAWHLTLRFVGDPGEVGFDRLVASLDEADLGSSFSVSLDGLGAFPNPRRAQVLWAGVGRGAVDLADVREDVEEAVDGAGLGREERPFIPHLTLARIRPAEDVWPWLEVDPDLRVAWRVHDVVLMRSHLGGPAPRYETIESFPLER